MFYVATLKQSLHPSNRLSKVESCFSCRSYNVLWSVGYCLTIELTIKKGSYLSAQQRPIIFLFFSGSGFLDLGFERSGFDVRFINEFHSLFQTHISTPENK